MSLFLFFLGATYRGSHYIQPELSQSQLSFSDLFLDPDTGRVRQSLCMWYFQISHIGKHPVINILYWQKQLFSQSPVLSCCVGSCSAGQDLCLFHSVELQDDSYSWSWRSRPQQTHPHLCLWWNSGGAFLLYVQLLAMLYTSLQCESNLGNTVWFSLFNCHMPVKVWNCNRF